MNRDIWIHLLLPKHYWPECFSILLHNKSLATGVSFCRNPLASNLWRAIGWAHEVKGHGSINGEKKSEFQSSGDERQEMEPMNTCNVMWSHVSLGNCHFLGHTCLSHLPDWISALLDVVTVPCSSQPQILGQMQFSIDCVISWSIFFSFLFTIGSPTPTSWQPAFTEGVLYSQHHAQFL